MSDISNALIEQIKSAYESHTNLLIKGSGSKQHLCGRTITGSSLSTSKHTGIISYSPVELVLTARSGTTLEELRHELDKHNPQHFSSPDHQMSDVHLFH